MDADSLLLSLELASGSGQGLSPDRRASLLTSLMLVKRDYRFARVLFWGRILGLVADYYIAQGLSEDQLAPRKTLYRSTKVQIKEESRLVSIIDQIDKAVAIIPRGALFKTPFGVTHVNRTFEGNSAPTSNFREAIDLKNKTLLEKSDLEPSLDFLDSLEYDIPRGSWSIQMERGNALVVLRSLLWPGLTFYHAPRTKNYGYIYVGTGEKNMDLPFML
ncbi:Radial spoke head protein 9 homolog [Apodemus speciosus]|uniref:Radial spoke head protein 9 homolog n=1 Tax=Apodemus speciosus TaxID=105296 RepID=A0ABQ0FPC4_APOSI